MKKWILRIFLLWLFLVFLSTIIKSCFGTDGFEFEFSTIINNSEVSTNFIINNRDVPSLGICTSKYSKYSSNKKFAIEEMDSIHFPANACCYESQKPLTVKVNWSVTPLDNPDSTAHYEKKLIIDDFPKKHYFERYKVSFVIGYQDCVFVKIESIDKQN